jgi:hypothetical protein
MLIKQNERVKGRFKQGQTIYAIYTEFGENGEIHPALQSYFLHSHKTPPPKAGSVITNMNYSYLNLLASISTTMIFTSKRKAKSKLNEEIRYWKSI